MSSRVFDGTLEAYSEQGWEGRIEFAFRAVNIDVPLFLQNGYSLTIYNIDGAELWSGRVQLVARKIWDNHRIKASVWSPIKQKGVSYAQWMDSYWRDPPLKAILEVEE